MSKNIIYSSEPEDFCYMDINVPCQSSCPAGTNVPAYIRALFEEQYDSSYTINRMANILPGVLGRICSRPCEDRCRHGEPELGRPVNICHIKRAAFDFSPGEAESFKSLEHNGKNVAIIGAGPSGLAAAHDLACLGFSVRIYEAMERPGGMLMYGIPEFRLPRTILLHEIQAILDLGVTLETGVRIGKNRGIEDLLATHDAVLSATGCYRSIPLDIPGETIRGVHSGLEFMMEICSDHKPFVGEKVLVIGAGFTAFDCARSALRLGAKDVRICLRRTEEDLRVTQDEISETKREGIRFESLALSKRILGENKVDGVEFIRTQPGERDQDGKRSISPISGSEFIMEADSVIGAIGQMPGPLEAPGDRNKNGLIITERDTFRTSLKGFYITGDYIMGPSTVIEAIAAGREAAHRISEDLTGEKPFEKTVRIQESRVTDRDNTWDYLPRQEMPTVMPVGERFKIPGPEVETGYSKGQSCEEAKRCYLCYLHYEIDIERCIYCRYCIDVAPRDCIKLVDEVQINEAGAITGFVETSVWQDVNAVIIDNSRCIRCGECLRVCPVDCISVSRVELVEKGPWKG